MAIILHVFISVEDKWKAYYKTMKVLKWNNDGTPFVNKNGKQSSNIYLDFDFGDKDEWKKFLSNLRVNGQHLPRKTPGGHDFVYVVRFWGIPKGYDKTKTTLFPGYDEEGNALNPAKYGKLYPL